ncbi:MAG TPA: peptidase domain-containing ABC transporter [Bacteroidales bacterium]|nr:peptidase domain-containing ABC transporter [Bacteroidales bacterium]
MKKQLSVKQHDITDCGAACLASVSASYGLHMPIARIRQYASTDKRGTNALGMVEAATKLGFTCKAVRGVPESLSKIPLPSIAHVIRGQLQHYVVLYKVSRGFITMMDPEDGRFHKMPSEAFQKIWSGVLILLVPDETFRRENLKGSSLQQFLHLLKPHRTVMNQALFGAMVYSILGLATSVYVEKIVDNVLGDGNVNLLRLLSILMIVLLVLRTYIGGMKSILALKTGQKLDATLILGYYRHLLTLPQAFFDTMRTGEIISRINDAVKIRYFINNVSLELAVNGMILVFTTFLMFVYSWKLTVITLICVPFFVLLYVLANRLNRKYSRNIMERSADLEAQLVESVNAIGTIKRFGMERFVHLKTETRFVRLLQSSYASGQAGIRINAFSQLVSGGITIVVLWAGSNLVMAQELTAGTLMSFYALTGYILGPILSLIGANQTIQDALIAAERLFQIMDLEQEEAATGKLDLTPALIGDICFRHVSFRYGTRRQVFENLNLSISKGKTTAIIGESGSGKTTLISLLQNLYPIQQGQISIGDCELRFIRNESLRRLVGTVPQEVKLFAGSILENIALGEYEPDMERVFSICNALGIRTFIEQLPQAYQTPVGEHGLSLSGGERQRIAIARALYKNPEILIFDEATSSLDSNSEMHVKQALRAFASSGKTVIVIAHRLSTIQDADQIIVLHQGKLVEAGSHRDLYELKGEYFKLWQNATPQA